MFRRLVGSAAMVLVAGIAVAGCAPVKMGSAAIVGNQRVTIANLDTEASKLASAAKSYPGVVSLTPQQITQYTLTWLIRFKINDQLANNSGITVSTAQVQSALALVLQSAQQNSSGPVSLNEILVASGIAPNLANEIGRYQSIELQFVEARNGGKLPSSNSAAAQTVSSELTRAQCQAAKSLDIKVNPQFGQLDYSSYQVVTASDSVSRPSGAMPSAAPSGLAPAC